MQLVFPQRFELALLDQQLFRVIVRLGLVVCCLPGGFKLPQLGQIRLLELLGRRNALQRLKYGFTDAADVDPDLDKICLIRAVR